MNSPLTLYPSPLNRINHKAQVGMEFLIIVGAVVFFVSVFLLGIQNSQQQKTYSHQVIQLKEIALTVQNEINLASSSSEGYYREFKIPQTAGSQEYEITLDQGIVYINTTNGKHALALPTKEVVGNINKTDNIIRKVNGEILLNQ